MTTVGVKGLTDMLRVSNVSSSVSSCHFESEDHALHQGLVQNFSETAGPVDCLTSTMSSDINSSCQSLKTMHFIKDLYKTSLRQRDQSTVSLAQCHLHRNV